MTDMGEMQPFNSVILLLRKIVYSGYEVYTGELNDKSKNARTDPRLYAG